MKKPVKKKGTLSIKVSCDVLPDGSFGPVSITCGASNRSGYCLRDLFGTQFADSEKMLRECFRPSSEGR